MPRRFQLSLRALLVAMPVVAAFFAGVRFERERARREAEKAMDLWTKQALEEDVCGGTDGEPMP